DRLRDPEAPAVAGPPHGDPARAGALAGDLRSAPQTSPHCASARSRVGLLAGSASVRRRGRGLGRRAAPRTLAAVPARALLLEDLHQLLALIRGEERADLEQGAQLVLAKLRLEGADLVGLVHHVVELRCVALQDLVHALVERPELGRERLLLLARGLRDL